MKKKTFAFLFSALLIFSFIFASCDAGQASSAPGKGSDLLSTSSETYEQMIRDLENRILELQQSQYISQAEGREELERLQNLLTELKAETPSTDTKPTDSTTSESTIESESDSLTEGSALFSYVREGDVAIITGYSGEDSRLVIPTMIDGYAVSAISDNAFSSKKIRDVVIPDGVTKIGWFAFSECSSLSSITIPASVTSIGYSALPSGISPVTIYCPKDSFAERYAKSYGISYANI